MTARIESPSAATSMSRPLYGRMDCPLRASEGLGVPGVASGQKYGDQGISIQNKRTLELRQGDRILLGQDACSIENMLRGQIRLLGAHE